MKTLPFRSVEEPSEYNLKLTFFLYTWNLQFKNLISFQNYALPSQYIPWGIPLGGEYVFFFTIIRLLFTCLVPGDALIIQHTSDTFEGNWKGKKKKAGIAWFL